MKSKKIKIAFAGIAIVMVSMTILIVSNGTLAQSEESNENSDLVAYDISQDISDQNLADMSITADCGNCCAQCANCDPSNCTKECLEACQEMLDKTCSGKTTCGPGGSE